MCLCGPYHHYLSCSMLDMLYLYYLEGTDTNSNGAFTPSSAIFINRVNTLLLLTGQVMGPPQTEGLLRSLCLSICHCLSSCHSLPLLYSRIVYILDAWVVAQPAGSVPQLMHTVVQALCVILILRVTFACVLRSSIHPVKRQEIIPQFRNLKVCNI